MKKIIAVGVMGACLSACGGGDYIAKVNGKGIEKENFDAYIEHKRIALRSDAQKEKVLDQYLHREALAHLIESDLLNGDALIQAEINELRKEILISRYFEAYLKDSVTDESISNYYNTNIDKYEEKKVQVAHILLRLNRNMDETQRRVKLTTAQEAYSKVQAGMDFSEAADKYSEDGVSANKGGDLGWFGTGKMVPKFEDAVKKMRKGSISSLVSTQFGFHIIKKTGERD